MNNAFPDLCELQKWIAKWNLSIKEDVTIFFQGFLTVSSSEYRREVVQTLQLLPSSLSKDDCLPKIEREARKAIESSSSGPLHPKKGLYSAEELRQGLNDYLLGNKLPLDIYAIYGISLKTLNNHSHYLHSYFVNINNKNVDESNNEKQCVLSIFVFVTFNEFELFCKKKENGDSLGQLHN